MQLRRALCNPVQRQLGQGRRLARGGRLRGKGLQTALQGSQVGRVVRADEKVRKLDHPALQGDRPHVDARRRRCGRGTGGWSLLRRSWRSRTSGVDALGLRRLHQVLQIQPPFRQHHHPCKEILQLGAVHLDVRWLRRLQVHTHSLQAQLLPAQQVFGGQGGRRMRPLDGMGRLRIPQQALDVHIRHPPLALELELRPPGALGELHRAIKTGQGTHQAYIQMRSHVRLERLQG